MGLGAQLSILDSAKGCDGNPHLEPQPGPPQALLLPPPRKGGCGPAGCGFSPPAALTLPFLTLPSSHTFYPSPLDLFKLCCKCNKPFPMPH